MKVAKERSHPESTYWEVLKSGSAAAAAVVVVVVAAAAAVAVVAAAELAADAQGGELCACNSAAVKVKELEQQ